MAIARWIDSYWGKARPNSPAGADWHPLAYHSLDVAAAMEALLETLPCLLAAVAKGAHLSVPVMRRALILSAALHDIGKFADNFQIKAPDIRGRICPEADFQPRSGQSHGAVGLSLWADGMRYKTTLAATVPGLDPWMKAACAHHGAPVDQAIFHLADAMSEPAQSDALAFVEACCSIMGLPGDRGGEARFEVWRVAGMITLADWIGSNQDWFPYAEPVLSIEAYWRLAQDRAATALRKADLREVPAAVALALPDLLDGSALPSPLQTFALNARPSGDAPSLYVVEDLTGAGKTEAALILAHRLMAAGLAEGVYWALPTMATANSLYERLDKTYGRLFAPGGRPSLVLAHGARVLNDLFTGSIRIGDAMARSNQSADERDAETQCAAFIADDAKKTFLAQIGVGTIDQALLSILPVRHQALRLAALSRRVLVIDEAHAYDAYMQAEMVRLLEFHADLGGSAIILSATLTQRQRREIVRCYLRNSRGARVNSVKLESADFPLVTSVTSGGIMETPVAPARGTRRDLPIRRFDSPDQATNYLMKAATAGLCGVYIRNTVKDAMATAIDLRARAPDGVTVDLFHARFAMGDRLRRENDALQRFGKRSTSDQRVGRILVATQVVEQSLDVDFDVMVSDLCPMDLLIQRAGRLQRHDRGTGRPAPELCVVAHTAKGVITADWYAGLFPHGQYVYPDVGQLWRTMAVLEQFGGLPLLSRSPRELIEPVFGDEEMPTPDILDTASQRAQSKESAKGAMGRLNSLRPTNGFTRQGGAWESDIRTPTRLGEMSVRVRLARWVDGRLTPWCADAVEWKAWRLSEITLRASQIDDPIAPDAAAAKAMELTQSSWPDRYDPPLLLPLIPTEDVEVWHGTWSKGQTIRQIRYSAREGLQI